MFQKNSCFYLNTNFVQLYTRIKIKTKANSNSIIPNLKTFYIRSLLTNKMIFHHKFTNEQQNKLNHINTYWFHAHHSSFFLRILKVCVTYTALKSLLQAINLHLCQQTDTKIVITFIFFVVFDFVNEKK